MQRYVDEGLKSGVGSRSKDELFEAARARLESSRGN
jgi:antitoxin ParD1/3/4